MLLLIIYSDELSAFIESKGAPSPGILTLTMSLSKVCFMTNDVAKACHYLLHIVYFFMSIIL